MDLELHRLRCRDGCSCYVGALAGDHLHDVWRRSVDDLVQAEELQAMSTYTATIRWRRSGDGDFTRGQYSRAHEWAFDGGHVMKASASPHVVPQPWSDLNAVDPEEAFVASLSSCHMLFFVDFARRAGFVVDAYVDEAEGVLEKNADGKMAMTRVTLRPRATWGGDAPDEAAIADLHHRAHDACFIANSVTTEVKVEY
jgi:organic hydroperoxide reductase OsmC/OhrA